MPFAHPPTVDVLFHRPLHVGPAVGRHYTFMKSCLKRSWTVVAVVGGASVTQPFNISAWPLVQCIYAIEGVGGRGGGGGWVLGEEPELAVDGEKVTEQWERRLLLTRPVQWRPSSPAGPGEHFG